MTKRKPAPPRRDHAAPARRAGERAPFLRPTGREPVAQAAPANRDREIVANYRRLVAKGEEPTLQALARRHGVRLVDVAKALDTDGIDASFLRSW